MIINFFDFYVDYEATNLNDKFPELANEAFSFTFNLNGIDYVATISYNIGCGRLNFSLTDSSSNVIISNVPVVENENLLFSFEFTGYSLIFNDLLNRFELSTV